MQNKICVVTGANSGIGKVTALELAKQGAIVAMVCRNKEKGEAAKNEIIEKSANKNVELFIADLSSQKEIFKLADEIKLKYPVIDVLVNNAGAINETRTVTVDGYETTFATNHMGYFIFTKLLLANLKAAPKARIINVASEAQRMGKMNFDDLQSKNEYSSMKAYSLSKLANIIFTFELANRLKGTNITANCLHPGVVRTGFAKDTKGITKFFFHFLAPLFKSPEKGAKTSVWLASSSDVEGVTGKYFSNKKEIKAQKDAYNPEIQKRLWDESEKLIVIYK